MCVSGGGSRPASPQGARVPDRVRVGRGPASGTPERRGPPASRPGLRSLAGENRSAGIHAVDEGGGAAPTAAGGGRRGLGPRFPRPGPRQEARRPAARPNRLRARSPACPLARSPARPPARPPASPDAPGTPCSRGPWALPRAWPGEGRGRDTRIAVACAASASPKGRRRHILAF